MHVSIDSKTFYLIIITKGHGIRSDGASVAGSPTDNRKFAAGNHMAVHRVRDWLHRRLFSGWDRYDILFARHYNLVHTFL